MFLLLLAASLLLKQYPPGKEPGKADGSVTGYAADGRAEDARVFPAGKEPAVTAKGSDLAVEKER